MGSRSESQRGPYEDARLGVSVSSLTAEPAYDECTPPYPSRQHRQCQSRQPSVRYGVCGRSSPEVAVVWTERSQSMDKTAILAAGPA